ncbi:dihydrofolate reductase [Arthrobacter pascens]|uniref:dihydrofolate reductase family protein n=1 Tax=Arthrobacter pascens TaxID=1677 RepID=UPI0027903256|nr:dihydrofolate reductase family protein [Arthrobacter pascens]MDQ0677446.1 dihydrofolate reductase [Arthrobacter pascens]
MAQLTYTGITSLDGYVADRDGDFSWSEPNEEVHTFVNDLERAVGTYLFGRRMYGVMSAWETLGSEEESGFIQDYARIWQAADKIVYSTTLAAASTARTRIEQTFNPEAVRQLKESSHREISVGGATLAASALSAGLVDECRLFISPVVVGGGTPYLPEGLGLKLELLEEYRFGNGVVYLRYRTLY